MGLFGKTNPQEIFAPYGFTVSEIVLDPPRFTFLPAIYQDDSSRRWAVKYRGAEPAIFSYADVLECEVVESGSVDDANAINKREMAQQIIANPSRAARINAAKRNMCLGMGVTVMVRTGKDETSRLEIPIMTGEVKRESSIYRRYRAVAEELRQVFESMKESGA